MKFIEDIPVYPDRQHANPKVCGYGESRRWIDDYFSLTRSVRGLKVQVCRVHSDGSGQYCETKAYLSRQYNDA